MPRRCCRTPTSRSPGFAETAQARAEIANLRTARGQRYPRALAVRRRHRPGAGGRAALGGRAAARRLCPALRPGRDYRGARRPSGAAARRRAQPGADQRGAHPYRGGATGHGPQRFRRSRAASRARRPGRAGLPRDRRRRAPTSAACASARRSSRTICAWCWAPSTPLFQNRQFDDADRAIEDGRRRFGSYGGWARSAEPQRQRPPRRSTDRPMSCAARMRARSSW